MDGDLMFAAKQTTGTYEALKLHRDFEPGEVSKEPFPLQVFAESIISGLGTRLAVNRLHLGVAANSAPAVASARPAANPKGKRGGARNSRNRQSKALTAAQITNLVAAARHAHAIGLPFSRFYSIHWEAAGVAPVSIASATGRFLDLLSKAVARHGERTAWIWIQESGPNKGGHSHILIHVPPRLRERIVSSHRRWLHKITGRKYRAKSFRSQAIGGRVGLEVSNPDLHAANLLKALDYVVKGADDKAAETLHLALREFGGLVIGKRCGTSQNIGPKARKANANGN